MKLESAADRLYRDKTSEIEKKYYISRDKVYLYFDDYDVELIRKTFLNAMPSLAENQVLFGWFVAKAVSLMK